MKVLISLLFLSSSIYALDTMSCLSAKSKYKACSELSQTEGFPLRDCLNADSGYMDCREKNGPGWHQRCLGAKSNYANCISVPQLNHELCLKADSGFRDCVILEANAIRCIPAKGGYLECRKRNPFLQHDDCVLADSGYAACMEAGGFHSLCMPARRSFQFCVEEDRMSIPFCVQVGKGYMECRKQFTLAHCMKADQGFADCVSE